MQLIKATILFAAATSALIIPRDYAEQAKNLADCDSKLKTFTKAINAWDGTTFGALSMSGPSDDVKKCLSNATTQCNDDPTDSSADTKKLMASMQSPVEPDIQAALNALVKRKNDFAKAGLSSQIKSQLADLRSSMTSYTNCMVKVCSSDMKTNCKAEQTKIDGYIANAQKSFP